MIRRIRDSLLILLVIFFSLIIIGLIWGGILDFKSNPVMSVIMFVFLGILLLMLIIWLISKFLGFRKEYENHQINKMLTSEIDSYLLNALESMDGTHKWYNDEEEANRELVTCLRTMNLDAKYQYRLPNGRTVDAKVGNILIEGKLSPSTADVDRLLGQLSIYTQYGNQVNIVIYGQLEYEARNRIINEILSRYPDQVFLTYLKRPQRKRRLSIVRRDKKKKKKYFETY